jgi:hypothetical protein
MRLSIFQLFEAKQYVQSEIRSARILQYCMHVSRIIGKRNHGTGKIMDLFGVLDNVNEHILHRS